MPTFHRSGASLYYETRGTGSPLLLLNGLGLDLSAWGLLADALSGRHRVVLVDARGAGRSDSPAPPYSTLQLAEDALSLLDELALGAVHVIGLSLGGLVAQELALLAPDRVRSLVLAATAARLPGRSRRLIDAWSRLVLTGADREAFCREQLAWVLGDQALDEDAAVEGWAGALLGAPAPSPQGFAGQAAACIGHDTRERAARIRAPALVLAGGDDALMPPSASEALAGLVPSARYASLPGGHAFAIESAAAFHAAVLQFLASVEA
jgi:pimeloyl-ACP methyl ester carboxylesterase